MALTLFLVFVVFPLIELGVVIFVADAIGIFPTIALLIAMSAFGAWLVKREGIGVMRRSSPRGVVSASFIRSEDFLDPASDPPADPEFLAPDRSGRSTTAQITGF